jgi:hypothetical protein
MTRAEQDLWNYIDEESDVLLIKMRDMVRHDGFHVTVEDEAVAAETIALKVLSAAMIKTLAVMCEAKSRHDLMQAYVEMAPMHADLLKEYMLKEAGQ